MGKTKGFLYAIQHREILMTDLGLYLILQLFMRKLLLSIERQQDWQGFAYVKK